MLASESLNFGSTTRYCGSDHASPRQCSKHFKLLSSSSSSSSSSSTSSLSSSQPQPSPFHKRVSTRPGGLIPTPNTNDRPSAISSTTSAIPDQKINFFASTSSSGSTVAALTDPDHRLKKENNNLNKIINTNNEIRSTPKAIAQSIVPPSSSSPSSSSSSSTSRFSNSENAQLTRRHARARSLLVPVYKPYLFRRSSCPLVPNSFSLPSSSSKNLKNASVLFTTRGYNSEGDAQVVAAHNITTTDSEEEEPRISKEYPNAQGESNSSSSGSDDDHGNHSDGAIFLPDEDIASLSSSSPPSSPSMMMDSDEPHEEMSMESIAKFPAMEQQQQPVSTIDIVGCLTKQVAGHSALLRAKGGKVCKPMDERELWFYQSLEERGTFLRKFTPTWHGCVALNLEQLAFLLTNQRNSNGPENADANSDNAIAQPQLQSFEEGAREISRVPVVGPMQSAWSEQLSSTLEGEVAAGSKNSDAAPRPYIVIDDITAGYEKPCILDIKMGKQEVKHSQGTTTSLYGFRVLGMMVYEPDRDNQLGHYRQFDKYQGRALLEDTVRSRLADFFWNGTKLRSEVLCSFLDKLKKLLAAWKSHHDVYKIMSGSLLFIYEGMPDASSRTEKQSDADDIQKEREEAKADVKMIDFQHAYRFDEIEKDDGYRWGLENLIVLFEDIRAAFAYAESYKTRSSLSSLAHSTSNNFNDKEFGRLSEAQRSLLRQLPLRRGSGDS